MAPTSAPPPPAPTTTRKPVCEVSELSGGLVVQTYRLDGKRHREDGPAVIVTENGVLLSERWFREDRLYRPDGPAETWWREGRIEKKAYRTRLGDYPEFHREDGPAVTEYFADGKTPFIERWFVEGSEHRIGGPAVIYHRYGGKGVIDSEHWFEDGETHRIDGPAVIAYGVGGSSVSSYYRRGRRHRLDGPQEVDSRAPEDGSWSIDGVDFVTRAQAFAHLRELPTAKVRGLLRDSIYAPLLEDTISARSIVDALAAGVRTPEGVREVLAGAPAEWVRSFEQSFFTTP